MASSDQHTSLTTPASFLSLSHSTRHRIYVLAGLVRFCPIDLNHQGAPQVEYARACEDDLDGAIDTWRPSPDASWATMSTQDTLAGYGCLYRSKRFQGRAPFPGPDGVDCVCGPLPLSLLSACRAVHDEAEVIFYTENQFKISRYGPGGLQVLSQLSPRALRALTSLHVGLTACGCVLGHTCSLQERLSQNPVFSICSYCHPGCKCGVGSPLSSHDPTLPSLELAWGRCVRALAAGLTPGRVKLSLVCDTLDYPAAYRILKPLQRLPWLASCAIRLGQQPDHHLRRLAEVTVRRVTRAPPVSSAVSPWWRLSTELQLQVLRHSSLLAPYTIEWREGDGVEGRPCCQRCTSTLQACCCPTLHAAFTSQGCICWPWPRDYFRVGQQFRQQALQVFWGCNKFSVHTLGVQWHYDQRRNFTHGSALEFLRSIPREALAHIRSLRIVFPSFNVNDLEPGTLSLVNWTNTLEFIAANLTLSRLALTLCTSEASFDGDDGFVTGSGAEDTEVAFYWRMVRPATILQDLQGLFVLFPPISDARREARNRLRERDLVAHVMGRAYLVRAPSEPDQGQGHPAMEAVASDQTITYGPAGERIWPPWAVPSELSQSVIEETVS